MVLLLLASLSFPALAEEPRVYTEQDLEKYKTYSNYDQETTIQRELDLKQWEKEKQTEETRLKKKKESDERQQALKQSEAVGQRLIKTSDDRITHKNKKRRS